MMSREQKYLILIQMLDDFFNEEFDEDEVIDEYPNIGSTGQHPAEPSDK